MKKIIVLILNVCMLVFSSCHSDNKEPEPWRWPCQISHDGLMHDGGIIKSYILYCKCAPNYQYDKSTKIIDSYSKMCLAMDMIYQDNKLNRNDPDYTKVLELEHDYHRQRTAFVYSEYLKHLDDANGGWALFLTAYVNGEVSITCDKVLWGEEPGTDLKKHFYIYSAAYCMPVGIENPKLLYNYGEMPENISMSDFFPMEAWLQYSYEMELISEPEERYDEITFTLTLPVKIEHTYDYILAKYRGNEDAELKTTEEVFTSQCTVKFNWK